MKQILDAIIWFTRQVGYSVCHQMPSRCLSYGGRHLPVCARDTGIYLSFSITTVLFLFLYRGKRPDYPKRAKLAFILAMIVPTLIDAITSYSGLRETTNLIRLTTGALFGAALAALVFPLFKRSFLGELEGDSRTEDRRMFEKWWSLLMFAFCPPAFSLLLFIKFPGAFYVLSIAVTISIIGTLFALVFTVFVLILDFAFGEVALSFRACAFFSIIFTIFILLFSNALHHLAERFI